MLVLDTHIWLWWIDQDAKLPHWLNARIANPAIPIALSAVSIYELSLGVGRGRIILKRPLTNRIQQATQDAGIQVLPVTARIAHLAGQLPRHHLDPLDRLIIATALAHEAQLASLDNKFSLYEELVDTLVNRENSP